RRSGARDQQQTPPPAAGRHDTGRVTWPGAQDPDESSGGTPWVCETVRPCWKGMELSDHGHSLTLQMTAFVRFFSRLVLVVACCSAALAARADNDVRFSATLTPAQRERAGLTQLNADNVAVIDGLVRQDEAASKFRDNDVDRTRFSERRTPREREIAGLEHLSASQLTALDDLVGR